MHVLSGPVDGCPSNCTAVIQVGMCALLLPLPSTNTMKGGKRDMLPCLQEVLDFNLVVFSPYTDLARLLNEAGGADLAECAWCMLPF